MKSFPHDSVEHDRLYSAGDFRDYFMPLVGNGIFAEPANSCMAIVSGSDRTITIKSGRCFINGCVGYTDGTEKINIPSADAYQPRYDIIVLRLDLNKRDIHLDIVNGSPSENPEYPSVERTALKYDLAIAAVKSLPTAYAITQSDITDLRFNTDYCGIVTGKINTISTTNLFAQYQSAWNDFIKQLGESDNVTINTEDITGRKLISEISMQSRFADIFKII